MIKMQEYLARQIEWQSESAYPKESCGFMLGESGGDVQNVEIIIQINHCQCHDHDRKFLIKPEEYIEAERAAAERKLELLGFYHSHPGSHAIPSDFDVEHSLPWFTYIIVSVVNGDAKNMTAWRFSETEKRLIELELSLDEKVFDQVDASA